MAQRGIAPFPLQLKTGPDDPSPRTAARLEFSGYHRSFLIGINAGHFNDLDSDRANDHAGLSRMFKLSAIMDILRANETASTEASHVRIFVPKDAADAQNALAESSSGQRSEGDDSDSRDESIMALRREGKSLRTIAAEVGCSASTVGRVIKRHS